MSRFRMYPTREQEQQMLLHCAHARYVWNLAVEQHSHWKPGRRSAPGFVEQSRQLTEARAKNSWLRAGNADVQQQALKDFAKAKQARFASGFGEPTWRKKFVHEGFRVIGTDRVPAWRPDGGPLLNARREPPKAKTFRVTLKNGQWHIAFAVIPGPIPAPGTGEVIGVDRGVAITAALSDGRKLNCPQLTVRERARLRKHQRRAARAPKGTTAKTAEYARAARLKAREAARRKDWCEKTSTMLAASYDLVRFEKLNITNMTASARRTVERPGWNVRQKSGLNRAVLAQGWGLLRQRTGHKAVGRVEDVPAPYTSLRCSACGWIEKNSRKSQAEFSCVSCGFACNADQNAAMNVAAGQGGHNRPGRLARAGGATPPADGRTSVNLNPPGLESPFWKGRMSTVDTVRRRRPAAPDPAVPAPPRRSR